jgi:outer membrane lipoprotein carrier protein
MSRWTLLLLVAGALSWALIPCVAPAGPLGNAAPKPAAEPRPEQFVQVFEARYRAAHTLQATFLERYEESGKTARTESGTAYFRRPGKMRWEYASPEKDVFLVDGKLAWFYVPADHTVMRVPAKQSTDWRTPLALLAGEMKVSRVCGRVQFAASEKAAQEGNVVLQCILRGTGPDLAAEADAAGLRSGERGDLVFFEIARATGELQRLVVRQSGGVEVEFRFKNWVMNPPVSDAMFRFEVPPGTAIVNGELPANLASSQ